MTVHSVLWRSRGAGPAGKVATGLAINLAENTGGRYTQIAAATAFEENLRQLAADMAAHHEQASIRYRVIYERPDPAWAAGIGERDPPRGRSAALRRPEEGDHGSDDGARLEQHRSGRGGIRAERIQAGPSDPQSGTGCADTCRRCRASDARLCLAPPSHINPRPAMPRPRRVLALP